MIYNVEIDNVTVGNHIITLQRYDSSFYNTSIELCKVRLLPINQVAGLLPPSGFNSSSSGTFSCPSISANTFINSSALLSVQLVGWTYSKNVFTKIWNGDCAYSFSYTRNLCINS